MRDRAGELRFLGRCLDGEPSWRFVCHVIRRLEDGEREHGDRWRSMSVERFLVELKEEAADLGGWALLANQRLADLGPDERASTRVALVTAIRHGAAAHAALDEAASRLGGGER
jgi:hypothetical protein